jgi:hypothetical protein
MDIVKEIGGSNAEHAVCQLVAALLLVYLTRLFFKYVKK